MPRIHVLCQEEAESLRRGEDLDCRNHYHVEQKDLHEFGDEVQWARLANGKTSDRHIVQVRARVIRPIGGVLQLVPGAPLLKGTDAKGVSIRDTWTKRQWTRRPRGFLQKPALGNA